MAITVTRDVWREYTIPVPDLRSRLNMQTDETIESAGLYTDAAGALILKVKTRQGA